MQSEERKRIVSDEKSAKLKITVCMVIVLLCFAAFFVRLVDWQLINGDEYKELAKNSASYTVENAPTRGEILDKNGVGLVVNTTHYRVVFDKLYLDEADENKVILKLVNLMTEIGEKWEDRLPISLESNGAFSYRSDSTDEVKQLLSQQFLDMTADTSASDCFYALVNRYKLQGNYSKEQLRTLVSVHYNMEMNDYSSSNPYVFANDISQTAVSVISENTQDISGVEIKTYLIRKAENPDLAPHILGALGSITEEEYNELSGQNDKYKIDDRVGKFGVELACESYLKGVGGAKIIKRNSQGAVVDTVETTAAKPGNTVYLTIDSKVQQAAVKSLAENVKAARENGKQQSEFYGKSGYGEDCRAGAAVMLSVKDFSVLAAASYPTYDLNKYSKYDDYYVKLASDEASPMYNRAFVGSFACGSVFKPCVALAALEEGVVKKSETIFCSQNYDYYPTNVVKCLHYHGNLDMFGAITHSCNYYFAETGRRLGIDTMYLYAEKFGLGEYTGVEIEESKGILAGRDSSVWMAGNTVQAAIGQSDNAFTPLQLAAYTATIANNGTRLKTHIIDKITNYQRTEIVEQYGKQKTESKCQLSQENLDYVKSAMLNVTQSADGTAYSQFGNYKIKVAAKTGTAENSGSDHTTFICYAPYDKPEVAVAVVIENGAKGMYSMQVAKAMLDAYFA